mmetsp:Transcript_29555/g.41902  ORF Transcript_29555/g.41902 Transcript_29555/m.41902 type:complete len:577 (+) Transcript_29555:24-1754(+)
MNPDTYLDEGVPLKRATESFEDEPDDMSTESSPPSHRQEETSLLSSPTSSPRPMGSSFTPSGSGTGSGSDTDALRPSPPPSPPSVAVDAAPARRPERQPSSPSSTGSLRPPLKEAKSQADVVKKADTSRDRKPGSDTAMNTDTDSRKKPPPPPSSSSIAAAAASASASSPDRKPGAFQHNAPRRVASSVKKPGAVPGQQRPPGAPLTPQQQKHLQQQKQQQQQQKRPPGTPTPGAPPPGAPPRSTLQRQSTEKREKNTRFQDVEQTGKWGAISKNEMYAAAVVLIVFLAAAAAGIYFYVTAAADRNEYPPVFTPVDPPTLSPTVQPQVEPEVQLEALQNILRFNRFTNTTSNYTEPVDYYENLYDDPEATPQDRAISWLLFQDPADLQPENKWLPYRYALAVMYYALNGQAWENKAGWMTRASVCQWYGVRCDRFHQEIKEVDLAANNLDGMIPPEINLLQSIFSLVLSGNNLYGEPPQLAIGSLPQLTILFLNNNRLNGTLRADLRANGILDTLMVQVNDFGGVWPSAFCPRSGQSQVFGDFGLDCDKIRRCRCCKPLNPGNPECDVQKYSNICY